MTRVDSDLSLARRTWVARSNLIADLIELSKLRLNGMVLVTTLVGYFLAAGANAELAVIVNLAMGTLVAAAGASALNQYLERHCDALMTRTNGRPLPSGRLSETQVLTFGTLCSILGILHLAVLVHLISGLLCLLTVGIYLFLYTPLKLKSPVCTIVGAIPGALPPLIGASAHAGTLSLDAWVLFSMLFMWQLPHFFAIAWIYRDDYRKAGMPMISLLDESGLKTAQHIMMCSLNLVFASLMPVALGLAGTAYFFGACGLGLGFLVFGILFWQQRTISRARNIMRASLLYLPANLSMWLLDSI